MEVTKEWVFRPQSPGRFNLGGKARRGGIHGKLHHAPFVGKHIGAREDCLN